MIFLQAFFLQLNLSTQHTFPKQELTILSKFHPSAAFQIRLFISLWLQTLNFQEEFHSHSSVPSLFELPIISLSNPGFI